MANRYLWGLFIAVSVLTIVIFGRFQSNENHGPSVADAETALQTTVADSTLPLWQIDYADSFIKFSGDQAGAPFSGEWQRWHADIQFAADQLDQARFRVIIETDSVFSNDQERDDTIRSAEFFDVGQFAESRYQAARFSQSESGFVAHGTLEMKGFEGDTILQFTVQEHDNRRILSGTATVDRLHWNIGTGDWVDTSWVGQQVNVEVRVVALLNE